jgi:hypothetical protein
MTCWADLLHNCSTEASKEHIVSKGLFVGNIVNVKGFAWCKNNAKEVGLSSLTSKILCRKHNNDLSIVDSSGSQAFNVFRQLKLISNKRAKMLPKTWGVIEYEINGKLLERWLLKTLINISLNSGYPIGPASKYPGRPELSLVEISFGLRNFSGKSGLYFVVHTGQMVYSDDTIIFSPLIKENKYIAGGLFSFRGFKLLLSLENEGPPQRLTGLGLGKEDWSHSQLNYHNKRIDELQDKIPSQVVHIIW